MRLTERYQMRTKVLTLTVIAVLVLLAGCSSVSTTVPEANHVRYEEPPEHNGVPMTNPEGMIASFKYDADHVTFLNLGGGKILMCNFADMLHKGADTVPGFQISGDGGMTWGEKYPGIGHDGNEFSLKCGCLVQLSGSKIGIATRDGSTMVFRTSDDLGHTWTAPVVTNEGNASVARVPGCYDTDGVGPNPPAGVRRHQTE